MDDSVVLDALADLADIKRREEEERKLHEEPASKLINLRPKMPVPETSSSPSIRRMHPETEGVRCETSREPILIPPFLAGHLREEIFE